MTQWHGSENPGIAEAWRGDVMYSNGTAYKGTVLRCVEKARRAYATNGNGRARCASTCDGVDSIEKQSEAKAKQAKVTICGAKEKQAKAWSCSGEAWRSDGSRGKGIEKRSGAGKSMAMERLSVAKHCVAMERRSSGMNCFAKDKLSKSMRRLAMALHGGEQLGNGIAMDLLLNV